MRDEARRPTTPLPVVHQQRTHGVPARLGDGRCHGETVRFRAAEIQRRLGAEVELDDSLRQLELGRRTLENGTRGLIGFPLEVGHRAVAERIPHRLHRFARSHVSLPRAPELPN
jgi:hypothetical protein